MPHLQGAVHLKGSASDEEPDQAVAIIRFSTPMVGPPSFLAAPEDVSKLSSLAAMLPSPGSFTVQARFLESQDVPILRR